MIEMYRLAGVFSNIPIFLAGKSNFIPKTSIPYEPTGIPIIKPIAANIGVYEISPPLCCAAN